MAPESALPTVSVIIPAHNAADTLHVAVDSVLAQSFRNWEVVIVDDGSTDDTLHAARSMASADKRVRVIQQAQQGVSAARNAGIHEAAGQWLVFLDSDDWLAPTYMELLLTEVSVHPEHDAVLCGWVRVRNDGVALHEPKLPWTTNLFPLFARGCAFAIHSCMVRRDLIITLGGFDTDLKIGEDWDLWQRVTRTTSRFGIVRKTLAFYNTHPESASSDAGRFLSDGLRVIERGHASDPRVETPEPAYSNGRPQSELSAAKAQYLAYPAGRMIAAGDDATTLLDGIAGPIPDLDPGEVADMLFSGVLNAACLAEREGSQIFQARVAQIRGFLERLEAETKVTGLTTRALTRIERRVVSQAGEPTIAGTTTGIRIDLSEPIEDVAVGPQCRRLYCELMFAESSIGAIELPVVGSVVSAHVIADAAASGFYWKLLGETFKASHYKTLDVRSDEDRVIATRSGVEVVNQPLYDRKPLDAIHDTLGWETFLRELWNRPRWTNESFYNPQTADEPTGTVHGEADFSVDILGDVPNIATSAPSIDIAVNLGRTPIGTLTLEPESGHVAAQQIRMAITARTGLELCLLAVREGVIGSPPGTNLRAAASRRLDNATGAAASLVLAQRADQPFGSSASRRMQLPHSAADVLRANADACGELVLSGNDANAAALYDPSLGPPPSLVDPSSSPEKRSPRGSAADRSFFESLFARSPDPWAYSGPYEQTKYEQTLSMIPEGRIESALEIACAEGHFTDQLAPRVEHLLATDISQIALDRAAQRCAHHTNISYKQVDLAADELSDGGEYDLLICSEMLYYIGDRAALRAAVDKMARALRPGGHLITAHAHLVVDEPDKPGYEWDLPFGAKVMGETIGRKLKLIRELRTPAYRIQLFRRMRTPLFRLGLHQPVTEVQEQPTELPPAAAKEFLWNGGKPHKIAGSDTVVTERLPILMYHSIATDGPERLERWRLSPERFDEQLRYLRDAGYTSTTFDEWGKASLTRTPLAGRKVLLTFDDGYRDFLTDAWPLLRKYGFTATVFLVSGHVGEKNGWDTEFGSNISLLSWQEIRALQTDGVHFGSHTVNHLPLTSLSWEALVHEAAQSRATISTELGHAVNSVAYPYGDIDSGGQQLFGACGYNYGVTCRDSRAQLTDNLLALPRIEVQGGISLRAFVAKLEGSSAR